MEKYAKDGTLQMKSLTECFMSNGKLDYDKAVTDGLKWWAWAKSKGYKHTREIEDVGDFYFVNGQWQNFIKDYWLDPRWEDPKVSEWVVTKGTVGAVYIPLIRSITAVNVERMEKKQVDELFEALGRTTLMSRRFFIDLLEYMNSFSGSIGLDHEGLVGRKILLEFDPASDYERVINDLVNESVANVEPIFIFTPNASPLHTHLTKQPTIKYFLTSFSISIPKSTAENEVLLPAKNEPLILDALSKVLETHVDVHVCFVFDILSELLTWLGRDKTSIFLRNVLDMLSSKKITALFLINTSAHEPEVVSQVKALFYNLLTYNKDGLKVVKAS